MLDAFTLANSRESQHQSEFLSVGCNRSQRGGFPQLSTHLNRNGPAVDTCGLNPAVLANQPVDCLARPAA